jgi:hypothetical protein
MCRSFDSPNRIPSQTQAAAAPPSSTARTKDRVATGSIEAVGSAGFRRHGCLARSGRCCGLDCDLAADVHVALNPIRWKAHSRGYD